MLRQTLARAEPGENDGDAPPDGLAFGKPAALAHEQQRRLIPLPELGHMRPRQVDFGRAPRGRDLEHRQFVLAVQEGHPAGRRFARVLLVIAGCHSSPVSKIFYQNPAALARRIFRFNSTPGRL
jgi:hypothetical protein